MPADAKYSATVMAMVTGRMQDCLRGEHEIDEDVPPMMILRTDGNSAQLVNSCKHCNSLYPEKS